MHAPGYLKRFPNFEIELDSSQWGEFLEPDGGLPTVPGDCLSESSVSDAESVTDGGKNVNPNVPTTMGDSYFGSAGTNFIIGFGPSGW